MNTPDFSNILGQETIKKVYEDGLSEPTKEVGKAVTDIVKTFRLFLAPFQLGAAYQDRFSKYLDNVRDAVPEENQIECASSVAGPIFEKLKYIEDENYLKNLYLNLLKRAIDKERVNEAHPAFISIIEQLSPDEAVILRLLAERRYMYELKMHTILEVGSMPIEEIIKNNFPLDELVFSQNFVMYIDHLNYLNLIQTPQYQFGQPDDSIEGKPIVMHRMISLSAFGKLFYEACIK